MRLILIALICLLSVESFSQTKFSLDPFKLFKKNSSEDDCSKKDYDECKAIFTTARVPGDMLRDNIMDNCERFLRSWPDLDYISYEWENRRTVSDQRFSKIDSIEQEILACSNFYKKCECWANTTEEDSFQAKINNFKSIKETFLKKVPSIKEDIARIRKQETQKLERKRAQEESERRVLAMRDSSANEIRSLIKEGTEANLILGKCDEHGKIFRHDISECQSIQDSISREQDITEITALLKANEFEKSIDKCHEVGFKFNDSFAGYIFDQNKFSRRFTNSADPEQDRADSLKKQLYQQKINDLCGKQLVSKVKKLPKKNITTTLAEIYFTDYEKVMGFVIQNDGKMLLVEEIAFKTIMMIQHTGHIGECMLRPSRQIPFAGYVKYLGEKTYTTVLGVRQSVPNYQLLWCD